MSYGIPFYGSMEVFDKIVLKYMNMYGFDITIVRTKEESGYDTASGTVIEVSEEIPARAMLFDLTLQSNGTNTFRSTNIANGDKQLFVKPPLKNPTTFSITTDKIVPGRDTIIIKGDSYDVVTFKEVNPSSTNSCLWELYIRK